MQAAEVASVVADVPEAASVAAALAEVHAEVAQAADNRLDCEKVNGPAMGYENEREYSSPNCQKVKWPGYE